MKKILTNKKSGFVILFAVLASTLILAMAISIFNVAYKEQVLTMSTKESSYADGGADVGIECAMYNDIKTHFFPDPNPEVHALTINTDGQPMSDINCIGATYPVKIAAGGPYQYSFEIDSNDLNTNAGYGVIASNSAKNRPGCVEVFIDKRYALVPNDPNPPHYLTHIVSRGYNVACTKVFDDPLLKNGGINPHIVERRSEVKYNSAGGTVIGGGNASIDIWASSGSNTQGQGQHNIGTLPLPANTIYTISWGSPQNITPNSCTKTGHIDAGDTWPAGTETGSKKTQPVDSLAHLYTYVVTCTSSIDGSTVSDSVTVDISAGGGGNFDIPELVIKAAGKSNPGPTEIEITLDPAQIEGHILWYPLNVKNCVGSSSSNTSWPSSSPATDSNGSFILPSMFPATYPVGDFTPRIYTISCQWGDSTEFPGTPITKSVKVNYQPVVNNNPPLADIYADPGAVGASNVGQNASGGQLPLTQADLSYTIRWNSSNNPTSCQETVSPAGSIDFPQSSLNGSQTIDPSLLEPGTYTYKIHCSNAYGTADDFVNVDVVATGIPGTVDLSISQTPNGAQYTNSVSFGEGSVDANGQPSAYLPPYDAYLHWTTSGINASGTCLATLLQSSTDGIGVQNWNTGTVLPLNSPAGGYHIIFSDLRGAIFQISCSDGVSSTPPDTVAANPTIRLLLIGPEQDIGGSPVTWTNNITVPVGIYAHKIYVNAVGAGGGGGGDLLGTNGINGGKVKVGITSPGFTGTLLTTNGGSGGARAITTSTPVVGGIGGTYIDIPGAAISAGFSHSSPSLNGNNGQNSSMYTGGLGGVSPGLAGSGKGGTGFSGNAACDQTYGYAGAGGGGGAHMQVVGPMSGGDIVSYVVESYSNGFNYHNCSGLTSQVVSGTPASALLEVDISN